MTAEEKEIAYWKILGAHEAAAEKIRLLQAKMDSLNKKTFDREDIETILTQAATVGYSVNRFMDVLVSAKSVYKQGEKTRMGEIKMPYWED